MFNIKGKTKVELKHVFETFSTFKERQEWN